jgi:hypothetical protein
MWAFSAWFPEAYHWTDEGRENAGDDDGHPEKCSQPGAAEHTTDNEAHRRYDESEQQPAKGVFDRSFLRFEWSGMLVWLNCGSARWAEGPR